MLRPLLAAAAALSLATVAASAEVKPAVVYDLGGRDDASFNESAHAGAEMFKAETGIDYVDFQIQNDAQREQALRRFAEAGANPIITTGFSIADILANVAADYPDTKFVNVDGFLAEIPPNVQLIAFEEHQGSYLVGMLAAMATKTGTIGFVGGMDIPLIRHFGCGYAQGAKAVNPDIDIVANMTGTTPAAWNDPVKGGELARAQISQGADVIYAAAGGTGVGVLQAAADEGLLSIGVDSNQNYLHPGSVLTSMLKRVDVAVFDSMMAGTDIETGTQIRLGLAEDGVGYAVDEHNETLITEEMRSAVEEARQQIIDGELQVVSYYENDSCPAFEF